MDESVEIKNEQLTLATIKSDTIAAAEGLTKIYAEHETAKSALASTVAEHLASRETFEAERRQIAEGHLSLDNRRKEMEATEAQHRQEVAVLVGQKNEASKELGRYNEWIATADNDLAEKKKEVERHNARLVEKSVLEGDLEALRGQVQEEEKKRDSIRVDSSLMAEESSAKVEDAGKQVAEAERKTAEAKQAQADAETIRDKVTGEAQLIREDCEVYIKRIEEKYQQAFPELRMPMPDLTKLST